MDLGNVGRGRWRDGFIGKIVRSLVNFNLLHVDDLCVNAVVVVIKLSQVITKGTYVRTWVCRRTIVVSSG